MPRSWSGQGGEPAEGHRIGRRGRRDRSGWRSAPTWGSSERRIERQRLGVEPLPSDTPELTFAEAADLWWSEHGRRLRSQTIRRFMQKHLEAELGPLPLSQVGERLESVLNAKVGALGPESLNHLRAAVHRVFAFLTRRGAWTGANPAFTVPRFKVPKRLPQYLRPDEVRLLLAALDAHWRGLFATAVYLGLRRGEVIALRKSDVDLVLAVNGVLIALLQPSVAAWTVGRDHGRVLAAGVLLVGLGYGAYALCHGALAFGLATGVWSVGEIAFMPVASATVAALSPTALRGRYQGAWSLAIGLGMTVAPVLGSALMGRTGAAALWASCLALSLPAAAGFVRLGPALRRRCQGPAPGR